MKKTKLLFIVEAMGGGVFTYIVDLTNKLVENYDVYLAYAVRDQTPDDYRDYFDPRIHLIKVKNFQRSVSALADLKAFFEIKRIADQVKPDVIHLHSSKAGALGRFAFNGHKIPIFYTPHGYSFLMNNSSALKRMVYQFVEKISSKRHAYTISCSPGENQQTLKMTKRAFYVDNGINVQVLKDKLQNIKPSAQEAPTVFTLGRISYQKNPTLFNRVAKSLPDVKFIWIGDGELRPELTAPNIEIKGWLKREDALKIAMGSNVFLLTSRWEGLPMSLLEAMYMKKPCVVSDIKGNNDVIHNGENGYTCSNVPEFTQAVKQSLQSSNATKKIVLAAYDDILQKYNMDVAAAKYSAIYQSVLDQQHGKASVKA